MNNISEKPTLKKMAAAVRPGGLLFLEEFDLTRWADTPSPVCRPNILLYRRHLFWSMG